MHTHTHVHTHTPVHEPFLHLQVGVIMEEIAQVSLRASQNDGNGGTEAADLRVPDGAHIAQRAGSHGAEAQDNDIRPATPSIVFILLSSSSS